MSTPRAGLGEEPPWTLDKLAEELINRGARRLDEIAREMAERQRSEEARRAAEAWGRLADDVKRGLAEGLRLAWADKTVLEIDALLPKSPAELATMLGNPYLDVDVRAKIVEVALLRGGAYPAWPPGQHIETLQRHGLSYFDSKWHTAAEYQRLALDAVIKGGDSRLFDKICLPAARDDFLPTRRHAATQFMHMLLQQDGWKDSHSGREDVRDWLRSLPPDVRGKAVYHLGDAIANRDIGTSTEGGVSGFEISAGAAGLEFGIGVQWNPGQVEDTHWRSTGQQIVDPVILDLDDRTETGDSHERTDEERKKERLAFYTGYLDADPNHELPPDLRRD
jgi:hypothetical protein